MTEPRSLTVDFVGSDFACGVHQFDFAAAGYPLHAPSAASAASGRDAEHSGLVRGRQHGLSKPLAPRWHARRARGCAIATLEVPQRGVTWIPHFAANRPYASKRTRVLGTHKAVNRNSNPPSNQVGPHNTADQIEFFRRASGSTDRAGSDVDEPVQHQQRFTCPA